MKAGARAFLDENYDAFLKASSYREPPALAVLEKAWDDYVRRYDVNRRPRADPYQTLLLDGGPELHDVLRTAGTSPNVREKLCVALTFVPDSDRPLVVAALSAMDGELERSAHEVDEPERMLQALRYVRGRVAETLTATSVLVRRLEVGEGDAARLELVAYAVNQGYGATEIDAWKTVAAQDQLLLARLVNALWEHGDDKHLALCAMRTVGDARSVDLVMAQVPMPGEGAVQLGDGPLRSAWDDVRRDVRESVTKRYG